MSCTTVTVRRPWPSGVNRTPAPSRWTGERERLDRAATRTPRVTMISASSGLGVLSAREQAHGYSHSIVPGGLEVTSSTTRLTWRISLIIREAMRSSRSYGSRAQSAVMASSLVTARITTT